MYQSAGEISLSKQTSPHFGGGRVDGHQTDSYNLESGLECMGVRPMQLFLPAAAGSQGQNTMGRKPQCTASEEADRSIPLCTGAVL